MSGPQHRAIVAQETRTCTLALSSSANVSSVILRALSATVSPSHAVPSFASSPVTSSSSRRSSFSGGTANGRYTYERSTDVLKMRSFTSASVVYTSRMKPSNAEPVDLRTVQAGAVVGASLVAAMEPAYREDP